jgi:hypothetical protein
MKRKSPVRHKVKSHTRNGHRVHSYMRGRGKTKSVRTKRKIHTVSETVPKLNGRELRKYTVELTYEDGKKETDRSIGYSVLEALADAKLNRKRKNVRVTKAVVKNSEVVEDIKEVMQEITSKGARVARTAAGVIDDVQDEGDRYRVEDEWR